ncbi:MAG: hypothetical protein Q8L27_03300 [archaeon]|nr:hypothetical protein [archaeon]
MKKRKAQIWVETVISTLIGLVIMGSLIAVVTPRINMMIDKSVVSQSVDSLHYIDQQIQDSVKSVGNQRAISLIVKKGKYIIEPSTNSIHFILENTNYLASQPDELTPKGDLMIFTKSLGNKKYEITLTLQYNSLNLTYQDKGLNKTLTNSPTAYNLFINYLGGSDKRINFNLA